MAMKRENLMAKFREILCDVIGDDSIVIVEDTVADDVPGWESANHVRLILALEEDLNIRFESDEITAPDSVGEMLDLIQSKLAA